MSVPYSTISSDYIISGPPKQFNVRTGLGEMLFAKMKAHPRSFFLVDAHTGREVTAFDILRHAVATAEGLRAMGTQPGDVIGICSENRLEFPVAVLATLMVGATCAPLNPSYTVQELKHTTNISRPSVIFCSPLTLSKVLDVQKDVKFLKNAIVFGDVTSDKSFTAYEDLVSKKVDPATFRATPVDFRTSVAVILCSSGTTGLPKCVELTDYNVSIYMETASNPMVTGDLSKETQLVLLPFFHGFGFAKLLLSMALNVRVVVMAKFHEELFLKSIQNYKVSLLFAVPPLVSFLAKHPLVDRYDLSSLIKLRCGAAPLSKEVQSAVEKRLNIHDIRQGYGMTELSIGCVFSPMGVVDKLGSSGLLVPGMDCKVIDIETGKALPPHNKGEICFKGPFLMKGYRNNKRATDETIDKDGWLHTGDIAYYDEQGFIFIVDRLKELIKYKGFQVPPAELEALLMTSPAVKDAAVIGIPDDEAGELPLAFIVLQADTKVTASEIQKFVADRVSPQKRLVGGVRFVEDIPKNPSGKILRRNLRALYNNTQSKL